MFEARIRQRPFMRRFGPGVPMHKLFIYLVSLGHFAVDLAPGALPAILPFLVLHNGISYTEVAGLMFASSCLASVLQPVFGYWADKSSRHWFIGAGIAMSGLGLGLTGLFTNYWAIFAAITVMGVGTSLFHPEGARIVNRAARESRATGMGIFSVGGNAGFGLAPLLAAAALTTWGAPGTLVFAVFGVAMALVMFWLVPQQFRRLEGADSASAASGKVQPERTGDNDWHAFARLTVVIFCRSVALTGLLAFLPLFCIHRFGITEAFSSTLISFLCIAGAVMTVAGGWLTDRLGLVRACRLGYLTMAPAFALILAAPSVGWIFPVMILASFALNGTYAAFVVLGQSYLARNVGLASGVTLGLSASLGGIFTPLIGLAADAWGIESVMYILTGIGVLCAAAAFSLPEPRERNAWGV